MINNLTIGVPRHQVDRSGYDPGQLEQFSRVTGINKTRHYPGPISTLIRKTLRAAEFVDRIHLRQVIVVTQTPNRLSPCLAMGVHHFLGLPDTVAAFDVNQSCVGFIYGLHIAGYLPGDTLLVCVDKLRFGEPGTLDNLMFSDACAVAYVTRDYIEPATFKNDGDGQKHLFCKANGSMKMDGPRTFDFATNTTPEMIEGMGESYDFLCPHQANLSILKLLERRSGFKGRVLKSIEEYGNQSMVSIPTALAFNEEKILGKDILLCGFGAGWSAATMGLRWCRERVSQIVEV